MFILHMLSLQRLPLTAETTAGFFWFNVFWLLCGPNTTRSQWCAAEGFALMARWDVITVPDHFCHNDNFPASARARPRIPKLLWWFFSSCPCSITRCFSQRALFCNDTHGDHPPVWRLAVKSSACPHLKCPWARCAPHCLMSEAENLVHV